MQLRKDIKQKGIDREDFMQIFNQWHDPVKSFIYYKTGDISLADDLVQDVFLKLWEKRKTIRTETVRQLLFSSANNLCKNRYEHKQVMLKFATNFNECFKEVSPEFELELKEFGAKLERSISKLSEKNRVVFLMNRIEGLTYKQIAQRLSLSEKAIEKRMKNALADLKKAIEFKL